jgi:hypothetical protein
MTKSCKAQGGEEETDKNATEYYYDLLKKAENIVKLFKVESDFRGIKTATEALESLIFPHLKDATSEAKTALKELGLSQGYGWGHKRKRTRHKRKRARHKRD